MAGKESALVYQMKVTLLDIRPPIWRRFLVTSDRTLYRLHLILQSIMGWENYHLYRFTIDGIRFGEPDEEYEPDIKHTRRTKLRNVIDAENQKIFYTYDYGDSWEHEILVEKILPMKPGSQYPICLEGERACPPEDCGGTPGYGRLLEIIQNPDDEEYEHIMLWLGGYFDPEVFDLQEVNRELKIQHQVGQRAPIKLFPHRRAAYAQPQTAMQSIDRLVAIIKPRQPFLDWLRSLPDWDLEMTLEELREDCIVLLIPEFDSNEEAKEHIEANYQVIFEMQLNNWYTDPIMWPEKRSLGVFRQWFDIEIHSIVIDTLDGIVKKEEW
ncbi:plasmid pRiA4b ORF-3 family protein [Candidatus Poribacteria bacterium]